MSEEQKPKKKKRIISSGHLITVKNPTSDKIPITEPLLLQIGQIADELGIDIYLVGGYVRDYYLNRTRDDFDITVVGDSIKFANEVARRHNTKAVIFDRFKTAMVPIGEHKVEFVGTRKEEYSEESRNPVVVEGTLEDDLKRRDFTINAIAVSLNKDRFGEITDLFNGREDIKLRILRTPLDPETTFSDDPLRILRAARFAAQLDFKFDIDCMRAAFRVSPRISIISQERITAEFLKIIDAPNPSMGLAILLRSGVLSIIFPELVELEGIENVKVGDKSYAHKDVFWHSLKVLDNITQYTDNTWLRLAALIHDIAKPKTKRFADGVGWTFHGHEEMGARWMTKIFRKMRLPLEHLPYVEKLVRLHARPMALVDEGVTDSAVRRLAVHAGDALEDLFILARADITTANPNLTFKYKKNYESVFQKVLDVQERDKLREFQSPVRGEEIMEICELKPSKAVGIIKTYIEEAILDGVIPNEYDSAKAFFMENKDKWLSSIDGIYKS
jgi:poly(A) polymerase